MATNDANAADGPKLPKSCLHAKFPLYTMCRTTKGEVYIGGGGGESKSGLENAVLRLQLKKSDVSIADKEATGIEAVMNLHAHPKEDVIACVAGQACYLFTPNAKQGDRRKLLRKEVSTDKSQKLAIFHPHGTMVMLATEDGRLLFLSYPNMRLMYAGKVHNDTIYTAAFNPNGLEVVTTSYDKTCKITRVNGCKAVKTLTPPNTDPTAEFRGAMYAPEGTTLFTTHHVRKGQAVLTEWNTKSWDAIRSVNLHMSPSTALALSPNGKYFASGNPDGLLVVVERESFNKTFTKQVHSFFISSVLWTKDSKRVISVSGDQMCHVTRIAHRKQGLFICSHTIRIV
eukprot:TRINITY_DN10697_c0_g2_i2.p1 TRINITY_DN10697_c0_g2~~TRINITY_DN10697_c0_g2_i2.p1  ORF type:complete len:342 (+),score=56.60 TRINITY_DN10697_c0_g2_i2:76-1101(+)